MGSEMCIRDSCRVRRCIPRARAVLAIFPLCSSNTRWICSHSTRSSEGIAAGGGGSTGASFDFANKFSVGDVEHQRPISSRYHIQSRGGRQQISLCRQVIDTCLPYFFAGGGIQHHHAVGVEIVAGPQMGQQIGGRVADRHETFTRSVLERVGPPAAPAAPETPSRLRGRGPLRGGENQGPALTPPGGALWG